MLVSREGGKELLGEQKQSLARGKVQGLFREHREMWCEMKLHLNSPWGWVVVECRLWSWMDLSLNPTFFYLGNRGPNTLILGASVSTSVQWE